MVFELDNIPRNTYDNETFKLLETYTKVWVSGTHRNFISISAHQQSEMLAIQFKSSEPFLFLHCPLQDLNDKVVPAQEIFGSEVLELREKIFMAENPQAKFNLVSNWLESRFDSKKEALNSC
ncbi:MAG: hypothetical protein IPJ54_21080 [Saprospiraceae bacterium]|nr:hypothetical protein [Saprospiraceae bacterium]